MFADLQLGRCAGSPGGLQAPATPIICCWLPKSHLQPPLARSASFSLCLLLISFLHLSHPHHSLPSSSRSHFCICASHASPTTLPPYSPLLSISSHLSKGFSHICSRSFEPWSFSHPTSSTSQQVEGVDGRGKRKDKMCTPQQQRDTQVRQETENRSQIRKNFGQEKVMRDSKNTWAYNRGDISA